MSFKAVAAQRLLMLGGLLGTLTACLAMKMPDTRERLSNQGFDLFPSSPQELAALVKSEYARFGKIVKDAGIAPE